jgi:hypothetical protein
MLLGSEGVAHEEMLLGSEGVAHEEMLLGSEGVAHEEMLLGSEGVAHEERQEDEDLAKVTGLHQRPAVEAHCMYICICSYVYVYPAGC